MFRDMGKVEEDVVPALLEVSEEALVLLLEAGTYLGWLAALTQEPTTIIGGGGVHLLGRLPRMSEDRRSIIQAGLPMIVNVYTEPRWRHQGVARTIMSEIIAWAEVNGEETIFLHASAEGKPLYEQLGFVPTNEMKRPIARTEIRLGTEPDASP